MIGDCLRRYLRARAEVELVATVVDGRRAVARRPLSCADPASVPIVMLAGLALSGRYLLPAAVALARRHHVWVPDFPGFGLSEAPPEPLDVPALGGFVVAWMEAIGLERTALVGNSMGCQVAAEVAARHPRRISHVVLQGPTIDAEARSLTKQAWRLARVAPREALSLWPLQILDWIGTGPRTIARTTRSALAHRIEEVLPQVTCPTLVLRGSGDAIAPQRWTELLSSGLPDGRLRVVAGAAHTMTYSVPEVLAHEVDRFLCEA